jgi:TctA family transporter
MVQDLLTRAEFYDFFGAIAFLFIITVSIFQLRTKKMLSKWVYALLLIIGIIGFIVDSFAVYFNFIR